MCNMLYLSTTSSEDFSLLPATAFFFSRVSEQDQLTLLEFPNQWHIGWPKGGCSCNFRHWIDGRPDPEFGLPEDWFPEDPGHLEGTAALYLEFARLIHEGHKLDVIDLWNSEEHDEVVTLSVSISAVSPEEFRFFEEYRFVFQP